VDFTTTNGSATVADSDYAAALGTLTFGGANPATQQITVNVNGDTNIEPNETFTVDLSFPVAPPAGVSFADNLGLGTINNDDQVDLSINNVTLAEGDSGTTTFSFSVSIDQADPDNDVTVDWASADGTATTADSDYAAASGSLTFLAGTATLNQTVSVDVTGDTNVEANETFFVNLSNESANASISDSQGLGTINDDDQVDLVGLIRIARREPKFDWRGRAGESSNPLFRGFKEGDVEEAERYDEPVLIRLNVSDEKELQDGFPKTAETLFRYHALILDDVESEFFTHDQMALIRRFVSERGGGFLMLGGFASYRHGQYQRTPIADLLPVYLHAASGDVQPQPPLRIKLSREGWLAPWVRLRDNEMDEQKRLKDMPHFSIFSGLRSVKPGASILSRVEDANGDEHPALVVQRFGRGRCGSMLIGDLWRWGLRKEEGDDDLAKAWRQTVRWLIADVPARLAVEIEERRDEPNAPVRLRVRVRDREYQALENASVRLTIRPPDGASISLEGEPSLEQAGVYEVEYVPRQPGAYRATVNVTDPSGVHVGRIEAGWTSNPAAEEFRSLRTDRQRLESFASATGGQLVPVDELESFVRSLPTRTLPVTERSMVPLWHRPAVFLFAIACLILEWGLRRFRGLP
ncbi:MAG: hypothetical protein IIA44_16290, partial [Acidobacteria bacterium]|nr:hypothetical protein [Acidobacteriota bacterium]